MKVVVKESSFDPWVETQAYERETLESGKTGGIVTFVGAMRDFNDGHSVSAMRLDHYPGMTERHIEQVCREAVEKWDVLDVLVVHRVGEIMPNDAIVLVAVWSEHRAEAFDACRYVINYLKERAPFWKQETTPGGARWVEHNTDDPGVADAEKRVRVPA